MLIDALLMAKPHDVSRRAESLAASGVDGIFTFEGPHDVFLPLALAAHTGCHIYTNVAIAFPRSPMHLAHTAWDLTDLSGGRFALGLGTQVKAHVERRYGSTWSSPVARMREWVEAIRAIGRTWQEGEPLEYVGEHTRHTLMTPAFEPGALGSGPPPIWLGALGPAMTRLATSVADGLLVHPFTSDRHLATVTLPRIGAGLEAAGRTRSDLTVVGQAIVACAADPAAQADVDTAARWMVAFYGSTPAYVPVLETEGRDRLHPELRALSREGRWDEMAALVDDDLLDAVVLRGDPAQVAARLVARFGDDVDRVALSTPGGITDEALTDLVSETRSADADRAPLHRQSFFAGGVITAAITNPGGTHDG